MLTFRTLALFSLIPIAACSGTSDGGGDDGGDKGNGGSGTATGGIAGVSGTGQGGALQGGTGPTGGTPPTVGGTGPVGGTGQTGGFAGVAGTPATGGIAGTPATGGVGGNGQTGGASGTAGGPAGAGAGGTAGAITGGAAGSAGKGGSGGSAGMPVQCPAAPADTLIGWATQGGMTTGGGNATATTITSGSASQLTDGTARVLTFSGTLSGTVEIGSNKTLRGMGANATINGKVLIDGKSNVILQNFRINASSSDDDGMTIQDSDHIWVDHLEIYDAEDGNMDITDGSDYITVSWTKFRYSGQGDHNFSNLIASSDSDTGSYRITFHHNWWANNVNERMPRVRFGQVHVFNNLYGIGTGAASNDHCIRAAYRANVRAESNYFDIVRTPHEIAEDSSGQAILQATTCANNTSAGSPAGCNIEYLSLNTGGNLASRGTAFTPPYTFASSMTVADCVKAHVSNAQTGAGPH